MGLSISKMFDSIFGKKEMRILMVGLDAAGKVKEKECSLLHSPSIPLQSSSDPRYLAPFWLLSSVVPSSIPIYSVVIPFYL